MSKVQKLSKISRRVESMLSEGKKSDDIARVIIAEIMTDDDEFTDLTPKMILSLCLIDGIQTKLKSEFLDASTSSFKRGRKSLHRKDRKENVDMFKNIKDDSEKQQSFFDRIGLGSVGGME